MAKRRIATIAHIDHGKTSLTAALARMLSPEFHTSPAKAEPVTEPLTLAHRLRQQSKLGPINVPRAAMRDAADRIEADAAKITRLSAELAEARKRIEQTISEWEALPGGKNYAVRDVEHWLMAHMQPVINALRSFLASKEAIS